MSMSPYPLLCAESTGFGVVSRAGALALVRTVEVIGLDQALSAALALWREPLASHDPDKIICDPAISPALGGDRLADVAVLCDQPRAFGAVASDPTVPRLITTLATDAPAALAATHTAWALARPVAWTAAGYRAPDHDADGKDTLIVDLDATLVGAHSDKQAAAPTHKRGFGFHPSCALVDHGSAGTGEPVAILLYSSNAGVNTAADLQKVAALVLARLPGEYRYRVGKKVLVRTDAAGATHEFLDDLHVYLMCSDLRLWLVRRRRGVQFNAVVPS